MEEKADDRNQIFNLVFSLCGAMAFRSCLYFELDFQEDHVYLGAVIISRERGQIFWGRLL